MAPILLWQPVQTAKFLSFLKDAPAYIALHLRLHSLAHALTMPYTSLLLFAFSFHILLLSQDHNCGTRLHPLPLIATFRSTVATPHARRSHHQCTTNTTTNTSSSSMKDTTAVTTAATPPMSAAIATLQVVMATEHTVVAEPMLMLLPLPPPPLTAMVGILTAAEG